jgi:FtsP/CotA-like multicopper oxidase with cupredoxin domain
MSAFAVLVAFCATPAAAEDICAHVNNLYPQPGRDGGGLNSFRPLPQFVPLRAQQGAPGTLSVSISVDHVALDPKGKPGHVYVGNYPVTDIPVFRLAGGASGTANLVDPVTGNSVPLPNACLDGPEWGYGGSEWSLIQGDTLDVMFQSRLDYAGENAVPKPVNGSVPCRASNLHTHGLLVSPYHPARAGLGPYGDYVFDDTQPRGSLDYGTGIDNCGTHLGDIPRHHHGLTDLPLHYDTYIPGTPGVNSLASGEHPSGLFWYHAHPHGFSKFQLHGGTTGVVTIGNLTDYACPQGDGSPGNCTITNTNIRVMALKDTVIQSYGQGLYANVHDYDSGTCTTTGGLRQGECQATDSQCTDCKWVFTVNGVEYPVVNVAAGRNEIWRIVNSSADVTYRLRIAPADHTAGGPLPFQLLAKDGVAVHQIGKQQVLHSEILMMPASRVEIAITAPPAGGTYVLRNEPAETAANGYASGDVWPQVDLAQFTWAPEAKTQAPAVATPVITSAMQTLIPNGTGAKSGLPARCVYSAGDVRVIHFTHRFVKIFDGHDSGGLPSVNEVFGLIAGVRHPDGSEDYFPDDNTKPLHSVEAVWHDGVTGPDKAFPALGHNNYNTVCTVLGNVERWELYNWTGEDHNFHLHQTKFTIDPAGTFFFPPPVQGEDPNLAATDKLIREFVNPHELSYNDTVPVPRGTSNCATDPTQKRCRNNPATQCSGQPGAPDCPYPGIMSVLIGFDRAEQVGTFVYHCHILEHEDGGMMAQINVICPVGDTDCASKQIQQGSLCTPEGQTAETNAPAAVSPQLSFLSRLAKAAEDAND